MRFRGPLVLAAAAAVVLAPAALPAATQLVGTVGPGFSINLEDASGSTVTQLDPGTYEIVVRDLSPDHNFHLTGPGVNETTQVDEEGTFNWTLTFATGRYTLVCDPHATQMIRRFVVGTPSPPTAPKPPATLPKLLATVGPRNTIALRSATGAAIKTLKARTYSISVRDRSKLHNFHLVGKGVNRKSGLAAMGTLTWTVKLSAGALRFYSDRSPSTIKGTVRVVA